MEDCHLISDSNETLQICFANAKNNSNCDIRILFTSRHQKATRTATGNSALTNSVYFTTATCPTILMRLQAATALVNITKCKPCVFSNCDLLFCDIKCDCDQLLPVHKRLLLKIPICLRLRKWTMLRTATAKKQWHLIRTLRNYWLLLSNFYGCPYVIETVFH